MKTAYPTFIAKNDNCCLVFVPDFEIYTEGSSFVDAIEMARDAIASKGITYENEGIIVPRPSDSEEAISKAEAEADDIFDYSKGVLTYVDVNFSEYREKYDNRMVRRNVTLPAWLNYEAEKINLNVSKFLQEALKEKVASK
ncbi:MAG: type II toxin-antitoxin system HicB family antitoxin [Clostridiales bacterium]|nr:type II toxin-antitoxin system HicB family antitoxin [Clostridiales bacterium]